MTQASARLLVFRALGPLLLRAPSDTTAAVHGPAVGGRGVLQPFPSSIAAVLASEAYRRGLCEPSGCGEHFNNQEECLRSLLGNRFHLYTGLAVDEAHGLYVFTGRGFAPIEHLNLLVEQGSGKGLEAVLRVPAVTRHVGIALKPGSKTVREGLLYNYQLVDPRKAGISYAAIVAAQEQNWQPPRYAKLGGKSRLVTIETLPLKERPTSYLVHGGPECRRWVLVLTSPALLEASPWRPDEPILLSPWAAINLWTMLIEGNKKAKGIVLRGLTVPKTVPGLEVIAPGWCMAGERQRPRKPLLHVPAGTWFTVEAPRERIEGLVESGLGCCTNLGWGTVAATCLDDAGQPLR